MSSCVTELEGILHSMLELKPPGVSAAKITSITSLCNANIQSESVLIQKVYTHFKKAPSNKKLGVLYVVDSVARSWLDQARKSGQQLGSAASDGTFAAGVNHVQELLPSFMNDIIAAAPEDQKAKIKKLVDIWERGNTFPSQMLSGFKDRLSAPSANDAHSTTPTGTPPSHATAMNPQLSQQKAPTPAQDTSSILANLQALASLSSNGAAAQAAPQGSSNNVSFPSAFQQNAPSVNAALPTQVPAQAVNPPAPTPVNGGVFSYGGGMPQNLFSNGQTNQPAPQSLPQSIPQGGAGGNELQQQLAILGALKAQGIPEAQWPSLLTVLMAAQNGGAQLPQMPQMPQHQQQQHSNTGFGSNDSSRDRNGYDQYGARSPQDRYGGRNRSRSPDYERRREQSPSRRRDSPVYGEYGDRSGRGGEQGGRRRGGRNNNNNGNNNGNGNNSYRQRSPDRFRKRSPSPDHSIPPPGEKLVEFDRNLGEGKIKVLSRTLFVGGVTCSENDLRAIFSEFGRVQTCIVNIDKRHAFVKMVTRTDAMRAKEGMEQYKSDSMQLRTRWGVGFGPRDCSDYQTGISIIPVDRLTDADRKWMTTAEYGGSGTKGIEPQMVVEEPDIEIGAGVSSKAISRRMQTDKSGPGGPRSSRDGQGGQGGHHQGGYDGNSGGGGGGGGGGRYRNNHRRDDRDNSNPNNIGVAPQVPSFGFPFQFGSNGMPILPPGFVVPGQNPSQPPPPGA